MRQKTQKQHNKVITMTKKTNPVGNRKEERGNFNQLIQRLE